MKRIKNLKTILTLIVITLCIVGSSWLHKHPFKVLGTYPSLLVGALVALVASLLGGRYLPEWIVRILIKSSFLRKSILQDLNVEGYWFVE